MAAAAEEDSEVSASSDIVLLWFEPSEYTGVGAQPNAQLLLLLSEALIASGRYGTVNQNKEPHVRLAAAEALARLPSTSAGLALSELMRSAK